LVSDPERGFAKGSEEGRLTAASMNAEKGRGIWTIPQPEAW
jgi:hypothetical protein